MSVSNFIAQAILNEEDVEKQRKMEMARRRGHKFFKVKYVGRDINPPRMHAVENIIPFEVPDQENPGSNKIETRKGASVVEFKQDVISGEWTCDLLDTEFNRFFVNRNADNIAAVESEVQAEIDALTNKKYEVNVSKAEQIRREIAEKQRELMALEAEIPNEEEPEEPTAEASAVHKPAQTRRTPWKRGAKKYHIPPTQENQDAVNQPVSNVD